MCSLALSDEWLTSEYRRGVAPEPVTVGSRGIHPECPVFVIAELSGNHLGSLESALRIIDHAAAAGASAIKLQHYRPETITVRSSLPEFALASGSIWDGRQLFDLYAEAMTPWEWTEPLVERSREHGLEWFSSPFDPTAVEFLEAFDPPAYKIASFELVDLPLIRLVAATGRPIVMSTGMASLQEIDDAVEAARTSGCSQLVLLRCNSAYPAEPSEMGLASIESLRERYECQVGLSDHTLDPTSAVVAVALGATVIEKHLTESRAKGGPDAAFSLEPEEFEELVNNAELARQVRGSVRFGPTDREKSSLVFRRSLRAARNISKGERITKENVRSFRPAGGLPPGQFDEIEGRVLSRDVLVGEAIVQDVIE